MKKPVIGISGSITIIEGGRFPGYRRTYVNEDYVKSIIQAGGVPLLLPMTTEPEIVQGYIEQVDGLVLSGGHDVSPLAYGEQPQRKLGHTLPERDAFDKLLIEKAVEMNLPMLGICRGLQIMNVTLGGSLYQDLDYIPNCDMKHDQYHDPALATHEITIDKDSRLFKIIGKERIGVNTFHHLAVKEVAKGFKISAKADDGVVEAMEHEDYAYCLGVQWHPEMMAASDNNMKLLFESLIDASLNKESN